MNSKRLIHAVAVLFLSIACCAQQFNPNLYQGMRWRMIGPFRGGRSVAVSGVRGQREVYYFGAVGGGVWKTTNGGVTWQPISDALPIGGIGALAVAPSEPNTIYVGTGEADIRSDLSLGSGVYKSTDGGKSWKDLGLTDTRQIGRILVDPQNANVVLVAALGHAYGPNPERGIFRSTDGGASWQKVLYQDENTGAVDLAFDPDNSRIVYAAMWNAHRPPWSTYPPIAGPGSGIYKSTDGGATWSRITGSGLPGGDWGRVGLAVARRAGGNRVYALIEDKQESDLYRSDNGGSTWQRMAADHRVLGRAWYFSGVTADPRNPDIVYLPNVSLYRSLDGGHTFEAIKGAPGGDDYHALWIDPDDPQRMALSSDQGTVISTDGGKSWSSWYNQPTAQFYHVAVDRQFPYNVYGAQQDSGTARATSRSDFGEITFRDWAPVGGGESGYIVPDPLDPNTVYAGGTYGELHRFDRTTGQSQVIEPIVTESFGVPINKRKYRFTWTSPLAFSPQDPHTLYMGAQYLLATRDHGLIWQQISPDLTGSDPASMTSSAPPSVANAKAMGYGVIYTIAPSPIAAGEIWVGADTGAVHITRDGGKSWADVTPRGLSDWSKISILDASHFDAGTAYAAIDRHRLDDYVPYIYRTHDFGKSWTKITNGIAAPAYVHAVREDPQRKGLLYAGTESGVYVSFDDGEHWQPLQLNLPATPVHDLVVKDDDLVIATHGRSFWILDDVTPLRQITAQVAQAEAYLFRPQTAIRIRRNVNEDTPLPPEVPAGKNPPTGAVLDYYFAAAPQGEVTLEVLDSNGRLVRKFSSNDKPRAHDPAPPFPDYWFRPEAPLGKAAGMNRFVWDLRYPAPATMEHGYSMAAVYGEDEPVMPQGPQALPGQYLVRLTANRHTYTQPLTIKLDPRIKVAPADLKRQFDFEMQIASAAQKSYEALAQARKLHAQLESLKQSSGSATQAPALATALITAIDALWQKSAAFGGEDHSAHQGTTDETNLAASNSALAGLLASVDSVDAPPTLQAQQAFQQAQVDLNRQLQMWQTIREQDVPQLDQLLKQNGMATLSLAD